MSSVGLDWYKRQPVAFLMDVQGLSAKELAVYSIVIDLLYVHGGVIQNDPKFISGYIRDMGSAAVKTALKGLDANKNITLTISKTEITQKRARIQSETKSKLSETRTVSGKKGGEKSAEKRAASKDNNDLGQASASSKIQPDKIREDKRIEEESARESARGVSGLSLIGEGDRKKSVDPIDEAIDAYNLRADANGWGVCQKITKARRSKLKARLESCDGFSGWSAALDAVERSDFLMGRVNSGRGAFRVSIDFMLQESSFTKIMEGFYEQRNGNGGSGSPASGGSNAKRGGYLDEFMGGFAGAAIDAEK